SSVFPSRTPRPRGRACAKRVPLGFLHSPPNTRASSASSLVQQTSASMGCRGQVMTPQCFSMAPPPPSPPAWSRKLPPATTPSPSWKSSMPPATRIKYRWSFTIPSSNRTKWDHTRCERTKCGHTKREALDEHSGEECHEHQRDG